MTRFPSPFITEALQWFEGIEKKQIDMPYGDETVSVDVPVGTQELDHRNVDVIPYHKVGRAISDALDNPFGPTLRDIVRSNGHGNQVATVVVCDSTRPVPYYHFDNRGILQPVLDRLLFAGIAPQNINILVALGTHTEKDEAGWAKKAFGERIVEEGYNIVYHDCHSDDLVSLGKIDTGLGSIEARINRLLTESNTIVTTGFGEPHFMAGVSGKYKLILPGCSDEEFILNGIHGPLQMTDPKADLMVVEGNPILQTQRNLIGTLVKRYGPKIFNLNVTMFGDYLTGVFAGDPEESHRGAIELLGTYVYDFVDGLVDIGIFPAGHVAGSNQYQCVKPQYAISPIMNDGGIVLVISEMRERNIGRPVYVESMEDLKQKGPEKYLADIVQPGYNWRPDEWQTTYSARASKGGKGVVWITDNIPQEEFQRLPGHTGYDVLGDNRELPIHEMVQRWIAVACYSKFRDMGMIPSVAYIGSETVVPRVMSAR